MFEISGRWCRSIADEVRRVVRAADAGPVCERRIRTDLATVVSESSEVRVVGRHEGSHLRHSVPSELQIVSVGQRAKVPAGIEVDPVARLRNRDREWHRATESAQIGKPRSSRLDGRRIHGESPGLSARPGVHDLPAATAAANRAL